MTLIYQGATFNQTFILVSSTDHISPVIGATPTVSISKNAAAFAPPQGIVGEIGSGWYAIALTGLDTNAVGDLSFHVTATGADPTDFSNQIIPIPSGPTPTPPGPPTPPSPVYSDGFSFAPSVGEVILNAFSRIQIRSPMVKTGMLQMAAQEANLMQVEWSNRGPNLWTVDAQSVQTVPGYATYPVDPSTVAVLEVTLGQGNPLQEILLTSISRTEYMSYPNKTMPGRPTVYWYDILISPTITLWPVPDRVYTLTFSRYRQQMDATMRNVGNFEAPYRWLDACAAGLAYRLSRHYSPALEQQRKADYNEAYEHAASRDKENAPIYLSPMIEYYSA